MAIEITRDEDDEVTVTVNGELLATDDGQTFVLPEALSGSIQVSDLPDDISLEICESIQDGTIFIKSIPYRLQRQGTNVVASFSDNGTRKYWDGPVGFSLYMESKRDVVQERAKNSGDLRFLDYDDDGNWIHLSYESELAVSNLGEAVLLAEQLATEIEGAADAKIGGYFAKSEDAKNERDFTLRTVIPLIRKVGFTDVKYNHGKREYGKDITFTRRTEFDGLEHWGVQVKFGDISGGVNSDIDEIIGQIDDGFKMPFYNVYTGRQERISKMAIVISGRFTENAVEKICGKIESHAARNNVLFIDRDKVDTLLERFRR